MADCAVKLKDICFSYDETDLFSDFNIDILSSKVTVFLGASGCGKTTLLNLISGLLLPVKGSIERNYSEAAAAEGSEAKASDEISVLFQEPRLLPWRSISRNIEIVLKKHYGKERAGAVAQKYLELVGLSGAGHRYPSQLSGGMRQRAAIARAFAYPAKMILMDEPFQALDLGLKLSLTGLFTSLWVEDQRTSVFVTHDINEAIILGDEIYVLSKERPVRILEHITNSEPHAGRTPGSENSIEIEKKLLGLLS